jgi:predicted RNA-binding Zn-ribbon protein involved in translation (DUF1610 family)
MYALAIANQLEQEITIEPPEIGAQIFECPDIECGAVFSYRRVSCGHFAQPEFCPTCGGSMKSADSPERRQIRDQQSTHLLG